MCSSSTPAPPQSSRTCWPRYEPGVVHVVVGSCRLTAGDYAELDRLDRGVGVVAAGNFSIMASILKRAAASAPSICSIGRFSTTPAPKKPDVPSGTSPELAENLAEVRIPQSAVPLTQLEGPLEARGAEVAGSRIEYASAAIVGGTPLAGHRGPPTLRDGYVTWGCDGAPERAGDRLRDVVRLATDTGSPIWSGERCRFMRSFKVVRRPPLCRRRESIE
jgi:hypothetical protein